MSTLRFDPQAGIAGDMALAALLDLGADFSFVKEQIATVVGDEVSLSTSHKAVSGIVGTDLVVALKEAHQPPHRHWSDIRQMLLDAPLDGEVQTHALAIFTALAEAESAVHGLPLDRVHFHEVGAWDSIADIVGVAAALVNLGVTTVETLPVSVGRGFVDTDHGRLPVPVPATARLLEGLPMRQTELTAELTTPTGAAILRALATPVSADATSVPKGTGWGAGKKSLADRPNLLRAYLLEDDGPAGEELIQLETNIDDANPEWIGHAQEKALALGALDAWVTPILMKKGRPGVTVALLCRAGELQSLKELLFTETSAIGVRQFAVQREALERTFAEVELAGHTVSVKVARYRGKVVNVAPEHDDLRRLSDVVGKPVKQLHAEATSAALATLS